MRRTALLFVLAALACHRRSDPAWANFSIGEWGAQTTGAQPAQVTRLARPPVIDGILDEWDTTTVLGPFVDIGSGDEVAGNPVNGAARVAWDETHLYVAFLVRDTAPRSPFARDDVDPHVWSKSSGVEIVLQPGNPGDNRDYYEIQVDVNGAIFDSHFDDYNFPSTVQGATRTYGHQDWSSHLERAIHVELGSFYTVEIALPWSALARGRVEIPPQAGDVWRMNLYTFKDGQAEAAGWSPIMGEGNFHRSSRWGRIRFTELPGPIPPQWQEKP